MFELFPRLRRTRPQHGRNQPSGEEQQMLAIGRALVTNPRLLTSIVTEAWRPRSANRSDAAWRACAKRARPWSSTNMLKDCWCLADQHVIPARSSGRADSKALDVTARPMERYLGV